MRSLDQSVSTHVRTGKMISTSVTPSTSDNAATAWWKSAGDRLREMVMNIGMDSPWGVSKRPGPDLAFLDAGCIRLMLSTPQGAGEVGKNSILYFTVSDIVAVHASLVERGATNERDPAMTAKMPDHELWTGFLRDPDGNLVGLMEEKKSTTPYPKKGA